MYCAHLSLVNFRNYSRLELDLPPTIAVIVGDNAQGKSNLLEAIYYLATTKSFRATSDRELINWHALGTELSYARLVAKIDRAAGHLKLEAIIREEPRLDTPARVEATQVADSAAALSGGTGGAISRRLKLNDVSKRAVDVIGAVNVVMFSPQDVELIDGSPSVRRRYLDVTISQIDSKYVRALGHYNRVLLQRNQLLRRIRDRLARSDQLFPWDHELIDSGSYIIQQRLTTLSVLGDLACDVHRELTGRHESLRVDYRQAGGLGALENDSDVSLDAIQTRFSRQIRQCQQREVAAGVSIVGPHRDDLGFVVADRDMNTFGSRGQQRTVALALKLAEARFIQLRSGTPPILLLDDVLSELDGPRRGHLLASIAPRQQVIFTATDLVDFAPGFLRRASILRVVEGSIALEQQPAATTP